MSLENYKAGGAIDIEIQIDKDECGAMCNNLLERDIARDNVVDMILKRFCIKPKIHQSKQVDDEFEETAKRWQTDLKDFEACIGFAKKKSAFHSSLSSTHAIGNADSLDTDNSGSNIIASESNSRRSVETATTTNCSQAIAEDVAIPLSPNENNLAANGNNKKLLSRRFTRTSSVESLFQTTASGLRRQTTQAAIGIKRQSTQAAIFATKNVGAATMEAMDMARRQLVGGKVTVEMLIKNIDFDISDKIAGVWYGLIAKYKMDILEIHIANAGALDGDFLCGGSLKMGSSFKTSTRPVRIKIYNNNLSAEIIAPQNSTNNFKSSNGDDNYNSDNAARMTTCASGSDGYSDDTNSEYTDCTTKTGVSGNSRVKIKSYDMNFEELIRDSLLIAFVFQGAKKMVHNVFTKSILDIGVKCENLNSRFNGPKQQMLRTSSTIWDIPTGIPTVHWQSDWT